MTATCLRCPYRVDDRCRRHPPTVMQRPDYNGCGYSVTDFPRITADQWCGEHPSLRGANIFQKMPMHIPPMPAN